MKRMVPAWLALVVFLLLPAIAAAQGARVSGQVFDKDGKPWPGVSVQIKSESGRSFTLKTDKDGKFSQIGLTPGVYTFILNDEAAGLKNFTEQHQIESGEDNNIAINFKEIIAQQATAHPEEQKKREEEAGKFKALKAHVEAGVAALAQGDTLQKQLRAAPADQKAAIQSHLNTSYQTAINEFQQAEPLVGPKDIKNHAVVWANLGQAYSAAARYDDAANAYQKAIDLNPEVADFLNLSLVQAHLGAATTDPAAASAKYQAAGASCEKAIALDPTTAAKCWKNIGIILSNKGDLKNAIQPLEKATAADPKDAQSWFLLGSAYTGTIESKQEGDKMVYVIPPGTADAYQKCIDADPSGPYAAQAKSMLDGLAAMGGGESTKVLERKKKKKK
jgi:tetratricopeptide (TPR) repeat protein